MRCHLALAVASVALVASSSAFAWSFGVGLEGAGTLGVSAGLSGSSQLSTSAGLGLLLEERLNLTAIELTLWEDAQLPYTANVATSGFQSAAPIAASYLPIDAGLRLGLGFSPVRPYVGALVSDNILTTTTAESIENWFGLGGDLGVDVPVLFLRFGLELRATWSITNVNPANASPPHPEQSEPSGGVLVLQGLASARFCF